MDERQQLIDAAWRVLDRAVFEGFKVQLVVREAGVSARTFYLSTCCSGTTARPSSS